MPLSSEEFYVLYNNIRNEARDAGELLHNARVVLLEDVEFYLKGSDAQTVQGDPYSSTGVNPKFSSGTIKDNQQVAINK